MSPAQEPTELERRYRRLLRWYPPSHRAAHREEMLGVLLATARPGQRRPGARQTVNLVACGLAIRAGRFLNAGRWQDALAVVSLIGPVVALALAALNVAVAVRQEVALDHGWRPAVPFWRAALVPDLGGPAVVMFGYLAVVLLALAGRRRAAAAAASVPLALSLSDLLVLVPQTGDWSIRLPAFLWTSNGGPAFPAFLASLAASSLAFSAGPRRGLAVAGRRRACLMIAGLFIVFGSSPAVPLLKPHAELSGPVFKLVYVLGIVLAIAVSRVGGTVGRRVAALVTAGFLPGLVTIAPLSIASGQTDLMVFFLGSLLVTVLVWPLAIVSWQRQVRRA